jgi:hypothetical protein
MECCRVNGRIIEFRGRIIGLRGRNIKLRGRIIGLRDTSNLIGLRGRIGLYNHRVVDDHLVADGSTQGEIPAGRVRVRPAPSQCRCGTVACRLITLQCWHQQLRYLEKNARRWRTKCKDIHDQTTHVHLHTKCLRVAYINLTHTQAVLRHIEC